MPLVASEFDNFQASQSLVSLRKTNHFAKVWGTLIFTNICNWGNPYESPRLLSSVGTCTGFAPASSPSKSHLGARCEVQFHFRPTGQTSEFVQHRYALCTSITGPATYCLPLMHAAKVFNCMCKYTIYIYIHIICIISFVQLTYNHIYICIYIYIQLYTYISFIHMSYIYKLYIKYIYI